MPAASLALSMGAVGLGAALGAWLRWGLALALNERFSGLPLGTWVANLVGGYGIGLAVGWLAHSPGLAPEWRLFIITGLLGGLTTFSSFSAEVVAMVQQGRLGWAAVTVVAHLAGSLLMTVAGLATVGAWVARG